MSEQTGGGAYIQHAAHTAHTQTHGRLRSLGLSRTPHRYYMDHASAGWPCPNHDHAGCGAGAGRVGRDGTAVVRIRRHPGASSPLFSVSSLLSSLFSASLSSLSPLLFLSTLLSPLSSSASKLCLLSLLCLLSFLLFSSSLISLLCLLSRLILYLLIHI